MPPPPLFITSLFQQCILMLYNNIVSCFVMNVPTTLSPILYFIKVLYPHYITCPKVNFAKLTTEIEVIFTSTSFRT